MDKYCCSAAEHMDIAMEFDFRKCDSDEDLFEGQLCQESYFFTIEISIVVWSAAKLRNYFRMRAGLECLNIWSPTCHSELTEHIEFICSVMRLLCY